MEESPLYGLLLFVIFIIINALMYAFGEANRRINESEVEKKVTEGVRKAIKLKKIIDKPERFINTTHIITATTTVIVGFFQVKAYGNSLRYFLADHAGAYLTDSVLNIAAYLLIAIYLMFIIVGLGVIVPKKIGAKYSERCSYRLVGLISLIVVVFRPFTGLATILANLVLRVFGIDPNEDFQKVTEEEIISIVNEGQETGVLEESEAEMISNIIELDGTTASDIMVHRKNILAVDGNWTLEEAVKYILSENNSRFPVYIDDIDNIIGVLHLRDAMVNYCGNANIDKKIKDIDGLIRQIHFTPETRSIDLIFEDMQRNKSHMVVVVDEYGQTAGIIAMEDILEEIVGNIMDEYDEEENNIISEAEGVYLVKGMTTLDELGEILELSFEEEQYDTLNGYLISKLERIPSEDEMPELKIEDYIFKILSVKNKMIELVRVKLEKEM